MPVWNKTCFRSHHSHIIHPVNWMVYFKARLHMRFLLKKPGSRSYKLGVISEKFSYDLSPWYGKGVLNFHRHLVQLQCDIKCFYNNRMCKRWTDRYTSSFRDTNVHLRKRVYINIDWLLYITLSFEPFCHSPRSLQLSFESFRCLLIALFFSTSTQKRKTEQHTTVPLT